MESINRKKNILNTVLYVLILCLCAIQ